MTQWIDYPVTYLVDICDGIVAQVGDEVQQVLAPRHKALGINPRNLVNFTV